MIHWIFYLLFKQAGPGVYILTSFIASNLSSGYARPNIYSWHEAVPCQFHRNDCSWSVPLIFLSVLRFLSPPQRLVPQENGEKTVKLINWLGGGREQRENVPPPVLRSQCPPTEQSGRMWSIWLFWRTLDQNLLQAVGQRHRGPEPPTPSDLTHVHLLRNKEQ